MAPAYGIARAATCTLTRRLDAWATLFGMRSPRPRKPVSPPTVTLLWPLFRYSAIRDAYILRLIGGRRGPVLVVRRPVDHGARSTA